MNNENISIQKCKKRVTQFVFNFNWKFYFLSKNLNKTIILFLLFSFQGLLTNNVQKICQVQEKNIEYNAKQIGKKLFKHQVIKAGLTTMAGVAKMVDFYQFCYFFYKAYTLMLSPQNFVDHGSIPAKDKQSTMSLQSFGKDLLVFTKNVLISKESCYALLFGSSAIATKKLMARVNHPHTMTWFVYQKVSYKMFFSQMCVYLQLLKNDDINREKGIYYKKTFYSLCNQIVASVEQLCGFMRYKKTYLSKSAQQESKEIIRYLVCSTNTWGKAVEELLEQDCFDSQQCKKLVTDFQKELKRELNHFSCVEGETSIDILQVVNAHKSNEEL